MLGHRFSAYLPPEDDQSDFERLLKVFLQLMLHTEGDVSEAISWLTQLDNKYNITSANYGIGNFVEDLRAQGYLKDDDSGRQILSGKSEQRIRKSALEEIFGKLKKTRPGSHRSPLSGLGDEANADRRPFQFGDSLHQIAMTESLRNAQINHGPEEFRLSETDLEIVEQDYKSQCSTVLMIDISHSMILYGEDRITPAKKTAMALAELITTRYPKDTLDIIVFGDDAWEIEIKDLPYLNVGPYHTNTVAGLELAMELLRRRKNPNRQIFMITDGKPTCLKEQGQYYKNSWGLDRKIIQRTLTLAAQCRRLKIPVTTFMIAKDPYLQQFVRKFTEANNGKAFYSSLQGLGEYVFEDYQRNRRKKTR
jgi:uncharacterized protein with von Willebrand factor type A (vWA) domain